MWELEHLLHILVLEKWEWYKGGNVIVFYHSTKFSPLCFYIFFLVVIVQSLSHVQLFAIPWTVARQAPLSMGFSRQEYWSGLPFPSPGDLPKPGIEPGSSALQANTLDKNYFTSLKSIISSNQLFSCECLAYFEFLAVSRNVIETGRHMKKTWKGD